MQSRSAWLMMEFPAVLVIALVYVFNLKSQGKSPSWIFLTLWEIHYIYRFFCLPMATKRIAEDISLAVDCICIDL